jgi:glutamate 5-kinase
MMDVDALIILSNVNGIYDGNPSDPGAKVIATVEQGKDLSDYISTEKSGFGRGGMLTKTSIARKVADEGITVIIANGKRENILTDIIYNLDNTVCTRFVPAEVGVSGVKKWIAHSDGFAKGDLKLTSQAVDALQAERAVSLLPIGVTEIVGEFEKDDIVRLIAPDGSYIGVGRAAMDSAEVAEVLGKRGQRPVVHYDYLYLE